MPWSFAPRNLSGTAVAFKKCNFIMLRGTKEGQECASVGHLETSSMYSGERQRKSKGTLSEQEGHKRN